MDVIVVAALVAADPDVVDMNRMVLLPVQSTSTLSQLRTNEAHSAWLFEELEAEEAPEQHDNDAKEAHVDGSEFSPAVNEDEAGGSDTGVIDLTSYREV